MFPYQVYANDAAAIHDVLAELIAGNAPSRVDVSRVHSAWLDRPPYPSGRLFVRGSVRSGLGVPSGFVIWYCCARYGRPVPVREWGASVGLGTPVLWDAPADQFSCLANPPWNPNGTEDGWKATYDAALDDLT
jgi:hypothetical protein